MTKNSGRIDYLILDKKEFKQNIDKRLRAGKEFVARKMTTLSESDACWKEFIQWDHYNLEMIKQAFEYPDNVYADDYNRIKDSVGGFYFPGSYREPTTQERIESIRDEMNAQVWKLEQFSEKIELLKTKPNLNLPNQFAKSGLDNLLTILLRFHKVAQELRYRRTDREPFVIKDEYDVQYLLGALLKLYFDDVRAEDYSPSSSGANTRLDFVLRDEQIIIETKMTNEHLKIKTLGEELLVDIGRYKIYPNCNHLVIFIYDKGDHIVNKRGFIADLEQQSTTELKVKVIIQPE